MKLKSVVVALSVMLGASSASAMTVLNAGPYSVNYDETTTLGFISSWFSSGSTYGFTWTMPNSASVFSFGGPASTLVALPTFTLTPNAGWALSGGVTATLGNMGFTEIGGATTNIAASADVSVDFSPSTNVGGLVPWTSVNAAPGYLDGYFGGSMTVPYGDFSSLDVSNASLLLTASGGTFSNILSNPQTKLELSFTAMPVPEPESYLMLLSGICMVGWVVHRRSKI